jgi:hypothetical protein
MHETMQSWMVVHPSCVRVMQPGKFLLLFHIRVTSSGWSIIHAFLPLTVYLCLSSIWNAGAEADENSDATE